MDNFIDDEEDLSFSEDDNDDVNDYLASMGFPQKGQNSTETQKCVVINDITDGASSSAIETNGIDNANDRLLYPGEIQELPSGEGCEVRARELDISTTRGTAAGEPTIHVSILALMVEYLYFYFFNDQCRFHSERYRILL